jgi:hypothetical protein
MMRSIGYSCLAEGAVKGGGSGQVPFLLAERARSECARSMRAVKGSLGHSLWRGVEKKMDNVRRGGNRG